MLSPDRHAILVGSDGFLGRHFAGRLRQDGWRITAIGREQGDLSEPERLGELFRRADPASRIFHVVTKQRTGAIQYDIQGDLLATNARVHLFILEAWRKFQPQARLVSTGSSCTYPESSTPLPESSFGLGPTHPSVRGYALAKQLLAVGSAEYAHQYGLTYLHCVLATMYGPGDHKESDRSHFVGAMLERAAKEKLAGAKEFSVWGDPRTVREVLHVQDQVDAILAADEQFENEILNCGFNTEVTVYAVAQAVLKALRWSVGVSTPPGSFQGTGYKMLDSTRFLSRTGWRPAITLDDGLRTLVEIEYPETVAADWTYGRLS